MLTVLNDIDGIDNIVIWCIIHTMSSTLETRTLTGKATEGSCNYKPNADYQFGDEGRVVLNFGFWTGYLNTGTCDIKIGDSALLETSHLLGITRITAQACIGCANLGFCELGKVPASSK